MIFLSKIKKQIMITKETIEMLGLDEALKQQHRQTGRSTRQIDNYIQRLFEDGEIIVIDHTDTELKAKQCSVVLWNKILRRLSFEHTHVKVYSNIRDRKISLTKIEDTYKSDTPKEEPSIIDIISNLYKEFGTHKLTIENPASTDFIEKFFESILKHFKDKK